MVHFMAVDIGRHADYLSLASCSNVLFYRTTKITQVG